MLKHALVFFALGFFLPFIFLLFLFIFNNQKSSTKVLGAETSIDPVIRRVNTSRKLVALTFDDGPGLETEEILLVLSNYDVTATFFPVGNKTDKFPFITLKIKDLGHEIGNHTNSHPLLWYNNWLSEKQMGREIAIADEKIFEATGVRPKLFRSPYGAYSEKLFALADTLGLTIIGWDVDPEDWRRLSAEKIAEDVISQVQPGSIILLHDGPHNADRRQTTIALPLIIEGLWNQGYEFVPVGTLLQFEGR